MVDNRATTPRKVYYVGVNSGTSVDAIDVAIADISSSPKRPPQGSTDLPHDARDFRYTVRVLRFDSFPWEDDDRDLIFRIINSEHTRDLSVRDLCIANALVGRRMGECVSASIERLKAQMKGDATDDAEFIIGCHGQTVWHEPREQASGAEPDRISCDQWTPSTLQIGESALVSEITGCTVVSDFRQQDLHAGGQGAPLTSILDVCLMRPPPTSDHHDQQQQQHDICIRALQNLGGIGNVTFVSCEQSEHITRTVSFDTGPANAIIDDCVRILTDGRRSFDTNGEMAAAGEVHEPFLQDMISQCPYFTLPPPKTTGRELFSASQARAWVKLARSKYSLSDESIVSTVTELTVRSIVESYAQVLEGEHRHLLLKDADIHETAKLSLRDCICAGGGTSNPELMRRLSEQLRERFGNHVDVTVQRDAPGEHATHHGINGQTKESVLFAFLAYLHMHRRTGNIESSTGAHGRRVLGKLTPK